MVSLEPVDVPDARKLAQARYDASPKGRARRQKYRHDNSKHVTDEVYLSKPIVGVDGEGVTRADGSHDYIMLDISTAKKPLRNPDNSALTSLQILTFLWHTLRSEDLNVIYGGGYDFNMWVKGLSRDKLHKLYKGGFLGKGVDIGPYRVKWTPGKMFSIARDKKMVTVYDTVAFFQQPFVDALDSVFGKDGYEGRDFLIRQKAARGSFNPADADEISRYNRLEVELLARLIGQLREHLNTAKLRPNRWYGPGALATAVMRREGIKNAMHVTPPEVASAARSAYAGGRFEMFKYGHSDRPVWEYDINSAYPAAIQKLPNLARGVWVQHKDDPGDKAFALYRVTVDTGDAEKPGGIFYRSHNGSIFYPPRVTNWVWSPEVAALRGYIDRYGGTLEVLECWEFIREPDVKLPFEFVGTMYAQRQNAKRSGLGVQIAYKLCLNSLYGKLAQQVGWVPAMDGKPAKLPPYHQLEWAGYVTSYARGLILQAITQDRDAVIAVETDALFTTHPLDLPLNDGLGAWKETCFDNLTYVQSGFYFADERGKSGDVRPVIKCRGVDKGSVTRTMVDTILDTPGVERALPARLTRFMGAGTSLVRGLGVWTRWLTEPKTMGLAPSGKRVHVMCDACQRDGSIGREWHRTYCPHPGGESHPFPVAWINPNPLMTDLEELRASEVDYAHETDYA